MATAGPCSRMACVQGAFIVDFDGLRFQYGEPFPDHAYNAHDRIPGARCASLRNSRLARHGGMLPERLLWPLLTMEMSGIVRFLFQIF